MPQETGETRDAILEDDNKLIEQIVNANSHRTDSYWIVLFAKASKNTIEGHPALVKHIKAYDVKPKSMVGMVVGEVNNATGDIKWEVNMPQVPFDFEALGGEAKQETIVETTTIPGAYVTQ